MLKTIYLHKYKLIQIASACMLSLSLSPFIFFFLPSHGSFTYFLERCGIDTQVGTGLIQPCSSGSVPTPTRALLAYIQLTSVKYWVCNSV